MRKRMLALVGTASALLLAAGFASPALADTAGTPVTLQIGGGALSITVPTNSVALGTVTESTAAQTVSANLGAVTVTDSRGGTAGWAATASAVDFLGPQSISVNGPGSSSYTASAAATTGVVDVAASNLDGLYPGGIVQTGTNVAGANTATWNPTIAVVIPASALAGTYSSTVTHSVN